MRLGSGVAKHRRVSIGEVAKPVLTLRLDQSWLDSIDAYRRRMQKAVGSEHLSLEISRSDAAKELLAKGLEAVGLPPKKPSGK